MALAVDATSSAVNITNQIAGGTTTVSHTVTGTNTVLIVSVSGWNNGGTGTGCSSVTYNGVSMTAVGNGATNGPFYTEHWILINPTTGTHSIIATVAGKTDKLGFGAISFSGGDQTTGFDTFNMTTGTSGTVSVSVTTTAASEYIIGSVSHLSANNPSAGSGTLIYSDASAGTSTVSQYSLAASAGSNTLSWTYPDPGDAWAYSVVAVKAAASGGGVIASQATLMMMGV